MHESDQWLVPRLITATSCWHTLSLCHSLELAVWREGVDVPYVTDACDSFRNVHIVCIISVRDDMKYLTD